MLKFKYVRIQGQELAANTMYAKGIFSMCMQMIQNDVMDEEDAVQRNRRLVRGKPALAPALPEPGKSGLLF